MWLSENVIRKGFQFLPDDCVAAVKVCVAAVKVCVAAVKVCVAAVKVCVAAVKVCVAAVKVAVAAYRRRKQRVKNTNQLALVLG